MNFYKLKIIQEYLFIATFITINYKKVLNMFLNFQITINKKYSCGIIFTNLSMC
jgi:hypothetical protein